MDDLFDLDLYFDSQSVQKPRGSAEQSTAALIASSMNSEYTDDWSHRQHQAHNHLVEAPSLVQLGPGSYTPAPNHVMSDSLSTRSANDSGVGSFGLPDELSLPPMSAPTDNINFIPQFSNLINYPSLEAFGGEGDESKSNGANSYGNNGSTTYGGNGVLGPPVCHELQRIDGRTGNTFMGIPISSKKDYVEETRYYTDLDIFKPSEEAPKNSDGSFLSPSIEVNNQYSPNDQLNVGDATSSKKKGKSPRKTPTKKKKGPNNENLQLPGTQNLNSDPSVVADYSSFNEVPNYDDRSLSFSSSCDESKNLAFPQYPMKPDSTTSNKGKVKTPRKTPSQKKKAPTVNYCASMDSPSLKMKIKCEKSIGTEKEEWSVSGDNLETLNNSPVADAATKSLIPVHNNSCNNENVDRIQPSDAPDRVAENKTENVPTANRNQIESLPKAPSELSNLPSVSPLKETRPPSTSKTKCPTAKAPSYLTGFPMRCAEYPIVYCCNHCARIFTSIRGGQLHECVKKRPGRKAGVKLQ